MTRTRSIPGFLVLASLALAALSACSESEQTLTCDDFDYQWVAREVFADRPGDFAPETIGEDNVLCGDLPATSADVVEPE